MRKGIEVGHQVRNLTGLGNFGSGRHRSFLFFFNVLPPFFYVTVCHLIQPTRLNPPSFLNPPSPCPIPTFATRLQFAIRLQRQYLLIAYGVQSFPPFSLRLPPFAFCKSLVRSLVLPFYMFHSATFSTRNRTRKTNASIRSLRMPTDQKLRIWHGFDFQRISCHVRHGLDWRTLFMSLPSLRFPKKPSCL